MEKYRAPLAVSESLSTIHEHPIDNRNIGGQILNHERVTPSSLEQVNQVAKDKKFKIHIVTDIKVTINSIFSIFGFRYLVGGQGSYNY